MTFELGDFFETFSSVVGPAAEGDAAEKKKGWLGKVFGGSAASLIVATLLVPACCFTGHVHAEAEMLDFPMCIGR
jgi:hypothetical protein